MGLHPDYRKDLYEQPLELLAALYWMCTAMKSEVQSSLFTEKKRTAIILEKMLMKI